MSFPGCTAADATVSVGASRSRPVDHEQLILGSAFTAAALQILRAQLGMEDAGTIHFRNHLGDGCRSLCDYRSSNSASVSFASGSHAAHGDSLDSHVSRQRLLQIREQT